MMKQRILVTGGSGFIGANLCQRLVVQEHEVICLDNLSTSQEKNIEGLKKFSNFTFIKHDIIEPIDLKVDQVYNLACPASPLLYQKDPIHTFKTSIIGLLNMLNLAEKNKATILQASTSEVYGDPQISLQSENYWGNVNCFGPRACYDEGKRGAETLCYDFYHQKNLKVRLIRIFNTYGPQMNPLDGRVVSNFIVQALKSQDLTIYGSGNQTRSFQYIDDLLFGMEKMMNNRDGFVGPVNIGNPQEYKIKELAKLILSLIPESKSKIIYLSLPQDDPKQRKPDISLAKIKLNWQPNIKLIEGLKKTIAYFRKY